MSIKYELSKIKDSFGKVRSDMLFLSKQLGENYDHFMKEHDKISSRIDKLSQEVKENIQTIKNNHINAAAPNNDKEIEYLKHQIKELKDEVSNVHTEHFNLSKVLEEVKKSKKDVKDLKEKLHSSELEIFLLKERLVEKDSEIKQLKDLSKTIFELVDDLSKIELEMINTKHKK